MCVVVVYFMFLIGMCIMAVVLTIIVQHLYLRSESVPFVEMPVWVSCIRRNIFHFSPHHQHYGARYGLFLHMFILSMDCGSI